MRFEFPRRLGAVFLLRYFLRYGALRWALLVQAGAEISAMPQRGAQWRGDLLWTLDWIPVSIIIVGPVIAGFAAIDMARTAEGAAHLSRLSVLRTPGFAVTVAYGVGASVVHLVVVVGSLVVSRPAVFDAGAPLVVLVQMLMLVMFASIGAAIGRFVGPFLGGIAAALAGFALVYVTGTAGGLELLRIGGATADLAGRVYNVPYFVCQAAMLALVSGGLLFLRPLDGPFLRSVTRADAVTSVAMIGGMVALSTLLPTDRLLASERTPDLCYDVQGIEACFYPQHERVADDFVQHFDALVTAARAHGYDDILPSRIEEESVLRNPTALNSRVASFTVQNALEGNEPQIWATASELLDAGHCSQLQSDEFANIDQYFSDLERIAITWVTMADPDLAYKTLSEQYLGEPEGVPSAFVPIMMRIEGEGMPDRAEVDAVVSDLSLTSEDAARIVQGFRDCTFEGF